MSSAPAFIPLLDLPSDTNPNPTPDPDPNQNQNQTPDPPPAKKKKMAKETFKLGPFLRLEGISINSLPAGARVIKPDSSQGTSSSKPSVKFSLPESAIPHSPTSGFHPDNPFEANTFIAGILLEALPFISSSEPTEPNDKYSKKSLWKSKGQKTFSSSSAHVDLSSYHMPSSRLLRFSEQENRDGIFPKEETWFCRRSIHENAAEKETASWEEFVTCFKERHPQTEKAFTPTVMKAQCVMDWDLKGMEIEVLKWGKWGNFKMEVLEMTHKIDPKPLKNRTFPIVQVSASLLSPSSALSSSSSSASGPADARREARNEFVVISIPINDFGASPFAEDAKDKNLVVAAYVAVERVRMLETGKIEWTMATASDARGVLPQWVQNMAIPSAIAIDVELFMKWIAGQRDESANGNGGQGGNEIPASAEASADVSVQDFGAGNTNSNAREGGDKDGGGEEERITQVGPGTQITSTHEMSKGEENKPLATGGAIASSKAVS